MEAVGSPAGLYRRRGPDLTVPPTVGTFCSDCPGFGSSIPDAKQMIGEKFSLGGGAALSAIQLVVSTVSLWPTPVTVTIYANAGSNTPGQLLFDRAFSAFSSLWCHRSSAGGYPYTFGTTPLDTGLLLQGTLVPEPASTGLACLALIRRRMASS